jgi:transposase
MRKIIKQVVGIDVAQNELVVSLGRMFDDWTPEVYAHKTTEDVGVRYVMEATGVYYESLAYFLDDKGCEQTIVLPTKISNYFRSLSVKTITDKSCAEAIAMFGLEKKLENWKRPKKVFRNLRQLTRERDQVIQARTVAKNQLHAEQSEAEPSKNSIERLKKQIALFNKQEKEINAEIAELVKTDQDVSKAIQTIRSVSGVGLLTAATVLAETNGFDLIRNKRQVTSYAGLDVREKQSGTSVKGKPRISKQGNKYLRKAMHLPALAAIRHDERFKGIYARLVAKHGIKMKAAVAVQRKLLELIYIVYKTNTPYDKNYLKRNQLIKEATEY